MTHSIRDNGVLARMTRNDKIFISIAGFLLSYIAFEFMFLRLNIDGAHGIASAVAATAIIYVVWRTLPLAFEPEISISIGICVVAAISVAVIFYIFGAGWTLPAHDPIAVPVLANVMLTDTLPMEVYTPGSSAYSYPPGQPIIIASLGRLIPALDRLALLKALVLCAVALTPATWAWMHARLFPTGMRATVLVIASYLVFFGLERTLGFAVPFAGKNAVIFGVFLSPFVVVLCVSMPVSITCTIIGALALFGLTLINYTLLHLMCALLGAYSLVGVISKQVSIGKAIQIGVMGLLSAALMFGALHEALADPRAGGFAFNFPGGFVSILDTLLARNSMIVIYADADFGISGFPYRGPFLIVCAALSVIAGQTLGNRSLRNAGLVYAAAILIALSFAFNVVPAGILPDFVRWFLWALQAGLMLCAANAIWLLASAASNRRTWISYTALAVGLGSIAAGVAVGISDAKVFKAVTASQAVSREELSAMQEVFLNGAKGEECHLIADSTAVPAAFFAVQQSKLLDYAEAVTPCRYMNGSWIDVGPADGRSIGGFPSIPLLKSALNKGTVFIIAGADRKKSYEAAVMIEGIVAFWEQIGTVSGIPVWEIN